MMKVLIAASEAHPFIKTGGLGDVIGALPEALKKLGIDVRVVIPNYRDIKREIKDQLQVIKEFKFKINFKNECCGILQYKYNDVTYYLLDNEYYFKRSQLYGYHDDGEKFAFFNKAVLEFLREIDWKPDIIHCNDWQTGMIPVLNKVDYINKSFYKDIKTVICIHNLFFQGVVSTNILSNLFGYNYELLNDESLKLYDGVSFLKGAINFSDKVITVSKTYAEEIQT
ncbi:MAG: glycogen synthase, partial [Clostridium sp.]